MADTCDYCGEILDLDICKETWITYDEPRSIPDEHPSGTKFHALCVVYMEIMKVQKVQQDILNLLKEKNHS